MYQINYIAPELQKDTSLSLSARCVLGRIGGLTQRGNKPCFASNEFLASECGLGKVTIQKALNELKDREIIDTKITLYKGKKTRYIYLIYEPQNQKINNSHSELSNSSLYTNPSSNNELLDSSFYKKPSSRSELSNSSHSELSTIYIEKDNRERYRERNKERDREMGTLSDSVNSISFSFDSVLSKMRELQKKLNYTLTDQQLQENAQSYIDKSQAYKFYKGEVTEKKLKAWLQNSIKYLQEKPKTNKTAEHEIDWEGAAERLQRIRQLEEQYDKENSEPVEADYQIIDELEDTNASA